MEFLEARQLTYYYAVRIGGRLEVELGKLSQGWQSIDWSSVPKAYATQVIAVHQPCPCAHWLLKLRSVCESF